MCVTYLYINNYVNTYLYIQFFFLVYAVVKTNLPEGITNKVPLEKKASTFIYTRSRDIIGIASLHWLPVSCGTEHKKLLLVL